MLAELQASRARIVEAADAERRRLERDLHDGAQQRLVSLAVALRVAGDLPRVQEAGRELARALDQLRGIARGIHPAVLSDSGLAAAVQALAETAPVPLIVAELPHQRLVPLAETTAYHVIAEAIRDSKADRVTVSAAIHDGNLSLSVVTAESSADPARLSDRVGAVGGTIRYRPAPDGRIELHVSIPCVS
jgi:signal transduction histidine kinase